MKTMIEQIRTRLARGEAVVLATIVNVEGSAYLREGAKMMFTSSGYTHGMLSPGCLEDDLRLKMEELFAGGEARLYTYDSTGGDDVLWGTATGCGGKIDIFVEPIVREEDAAPGGRPSLAVLADLLDRRHTVAVAKRIGGPPARGEMLFALGDGRIFDGLGGGPGAARVAAAAAELLRAGDGFRLLEDSGGVFFIERYAPQERLFVFGAGADAEPLVELAVRLGFHVVVIDPRASRCNRDCFPSAHAHVVAHPGDAFGQLDIGEDDYVLAMTHHFPRDQEIIAGLLAVRPHYAGVLGPRRRTLQLLGADSLPEFIYSPAGLPIGAKGPEEIAVSIMAEIVQIRRNGAKDGDRGKRS